MIFDLILFMNVLIADLAVELPIIFGLVVGVNPGRTAEKVKTVLLNDDSFREDLVLMLTEDLFKPIKWNDGKGNLVDIAPIDIVSNHLITGMKQWINGKQSELTQELDKNATEAMQIDQQNPLQALALQQIPKKYRPYIQLLANMFLQQQR